MVNKQSLETPWQAALEGVPKLNVGRRDTGEKIFEDDSQHDTALCCSLPLASLEEEMATHSSILACILMDRGAWRATELQRVGGD